MPRVTIGVPVYNSEKFLEQCLENLAAQTFKDFNVIVLDNASTDGTGVIGKRFAARDPRFTYVEQPLNKGALQNFADVLAVAQTPYFMWRGDDDASHLNFVEELVLLLDTTPDAVLAVGDLVLDKHGRKRRICFPTRRRWELAGLYPIRLLLRSRAPWIYGLFRTNELRSSFASVAAAYRHTIGFDHLVLFPFLLTSRVVGTSATSFTTGFVRREPDQTPKSFIVPQTMHTLRQDFQRYCQSEVRRLVRNRFLICLLHPVLLLYAERSFRWPKILYSYYRVFLGDEPRGATTKYN